MPFGRNSYQWKSLRQPKTHRNFPFLFFCVFFFLFSLEVISTFVLVETNCMWLPPGQPHAIFEGWHSVWCVFERPNNHMVANAWNFTVWTDVNACDHTQVLYKHNLKKQTTKNRPREEKAFSHQGVKPVPTACWSGHSSTTRCMQRGLYRHWK